MSSYFVGILMFLLILAIGGALLYYKILLKRRYSRERFAFVGVGTISSFLILAMGALLVRPWLEDVILGLLNESGLEGQAIGGESADTYRLHPRGRRHACLCCAQSASQLAWADQPAGSR